MLVGRFLDGHDIQQIVVELPPQVEWLVLDDILVVLVSPVEFLELSLLMGRIMVSLFFPQLDQPLSPLFFELLFFVVALLHAFVETLLFGHDRPLILQVVQRIRVHQVAAVIEGIQIVAGTNALRIVNVVLVLLLLQFFRFLTIGVEILILIPIINRRQNR